MAKILIIETSGATCSVAVSENGVLLGEKSDNKGGAMATASSEHSTQLAPFIEDVLGQYGKCDAVAVSYGPGSYTGLRIGLSTAKGLCYAAGIPMILIDSLRPLVEEAKAQSAEGDTLLAMIDARRMEVFMARYNARGEQIGEIHPEIIDENSFDGIEGRVVLFGSGAKKCEEILKAKALDYIILDVAPSAKSLSEFAFKKFEAEDFADVAYAEPLYIKEWQPTTVKKK